MSIRHVLPAAALAFGLAGFALGAQAAVFADFQPDTNAADFSWVQAPPSGGALASVNVATHFTFLDPSLSALVFLPATFNLAASVPTGNPAVNNGGGSFTQKDVNGTFSFIYSGPTTTVGGHLLTQNVTNLLSGSFSNAFLQGVGGSGSANLAAVTGSASYNSDLETFPNLKPGSEEFSFNLLDVSPGFNAGSGKSLDSFSANGGGNFSFISNVTRSFTPEPATWGLMITGFGLVGAVVRRRRRSALA